MSYQTPELLLVGTAHSLVLGTVEGKGLDYNEDHPGAGLYDPNTNFDSGGW